ncbi:MAG: dTDP-glucose 4,6-dehydratase [Pseudomonadota bacterium]
MSVQRKKTILVTGGAGFIGSHFVELAIGTGRRVVVLDAFTYAGHRENLEHIPESDDYHLIHGDIRDAELLSKLFQKHRVDEIINLAAETHVDRSIEDAALFLHTNVVGTFNLLRTALSCWESLDEAGREAFRFVQVSTDEVFGSLGSAGKFDERSPVQPRSPYSASKAGADHLVSAWHSTYGLPVITTHCSNNYGPRQHPEKLIPHMITQALEGRPLPVYGDGRNVRDWIHVEDHCRGLILALERGVPGHRYCFGGGEEWANIDLVKLICGELDRLHPRSDGRRHEEGIEFVKDRLGHDRRYAIDDSLARRELGFSCSHEFRDGIAATVKWYVENQGWCTKVLSKGGSA